MRTVQLKRLLLPGTSLGAFCNSDDTATLCPSGTRMLYMKSSSCTCASSSAQIFAASWHLYRGQSDLRQYSHGSCTYAYSSAQTSAASWHLFGGILHLRRYSHGSCTGAPVHGAIIWDLLPWYLYRERNRGLRHVALGISNNSAMNVHNASSMSVCTAKHVLERGGDGYQRKYSVRISLALKQLPSLSYGQACVHE